MQNIPVFMAQGGTATLILREIPYRRTAYILLRTLPPEGPDAMIAECAGFCRSCGAEACFVSPGSSDAVLTLPHAYDILMLQAEKAALPQPEHPFSLVPLSPDNDAIYQRIYNQCFQTVSHALTYDRAQIERIYRCGHRAFLALNPDGTPCGMGELHENELAAVGLLPDYRGGGRELTLSLLEHCTGPQIRLTVVSDNLPALRLYRRLGFTPAGVESSWYQA